MARKSAADDFVELIALMPWWVGVLGAFISYLLFTALASQPISGVNNGVPTVNFLPAFSMVLRWLVPLLCLAGAFTSFAGRSRRRTLLARARGSPAETVQGIGWREFEMLVGQAFRTKGYSVVERGGGGPDGGVDLLLRRGDEKVLVQCKHWKTYRVGVAVVREMLGSMTAQRVTQGMVITSGRYTDEARRFAREHGIRLVDGESLPEWLGAAKAEAGSGAGQTPMQAQEAAGAVPAAGRACPPAAPEAGNARFAGRPLAPACPLCGKAMMDRIAKKGVNAGAAFWGCPGYPVCRGTRPK